MPFLLSLIGGFRFLRENYFTERFCDQEGMFFVEGERVGCRVKGVEVK